MPWLSLKIVLIMFKIKGKPGKDNTNKGYPCTVFINMRQKKVRKDKLFFYLRSKSAGWDSFNFFKSSPECIPG
jgi:hypothetical protein